LVNYYIGIGKLTDTNTVT